MDIDELIGPQLRRRRPSVSTDTAWASLQGRVARRRNRRKAVVLGGALIALVTLASAVVLAGDESSTDVETSTEDAATSHPVALATAGGYFHPHHCPPARGRAQSGQGPRS